MKYLLSLVLLISSILAQTTTWIAPNQKQSKLIWMDSLSQFENRLTPLRLNDVTVVPGPFQDRQGGPLMAEIRGLTGISRLPDAEWYRIPGKTWPVWRTLPVPIRRRGASGICSTPDGRVFVTWRWSHQISEGHIQKDHLVEDSVWGTPGRADGQLGEPLGIAVSTAGKYFILERLNNRISVFNSDHSLDRILYPTRQFPMRNAVAMTLHDGAAHWTNQRKSYLVVIDKDGHRLTRIGTDGNLQAVMDQKFPFKTFDFEKVATDYYGCIYVTDSLNHAVHKFDSRLHYLVTIGPKTDAGTLIDPMGIAIDHQYGQVWVSDTTGVHYYWIGTDTLDWRAGFSRFKNSVMGKFRLTEPAYVTVQIKNSAGETLAKLIDHEKYLFNAINYAWPLPWGTKDPVVTVEVRLTPTYGSRRQFSKVITQPVSLVAAPQ